MLIVTTENIPGRRYEVLGVVKGNVVQSKNFGKAFMSAMKTLVGGESTAYTERLVEALLIAAGRMAAQADALGPLAVVGLRYAPITVMQGAAECIAYGTAVRFID